MTHAGASEFAIALDAERKIALSGAVSGSAAFDGSEDVIIQATITQSAAPTATSQGMAGSMILSGETLYVCTAANTWKQVALSDIAA